MAWSKLTSFLPPLFHLAPSLPFSFLPLTQFLTVSHDRKGGEWSGCSHPASSSGRQVCKPSSVCSCYVKDAGSTEKLSHNGQHLTDLREVHHEDKRSTEPMVKPISAQGRKVKSCSIKGTTGSLSFEAGRGATILSSGPGEVPANHIPCSTNPRLEPILGAVPFLGFVP